MNHRAHCADVSLGAKMSTEKVSGLFWETGMLQNSFKNSPEALTEKNDVWRNSFFAHWLNRPVLSSLSIAVLFPGEDQLPGNHTQPQGGLLHHTVGHLIPAPPVYMLKCPWARHWLLNWWSGQDLELWWPPSVCVCSCYSSVRVKHAVF